MNKRLPVMRMFAEGAIIVTSILLVFGIDAWWDERRDRIEETEILLTITDYADAASRLWGDPEFRYILAVRYGFASHTTGAYEAALEAIDAILRQIDKSLSE